MNRPREISESEVKQFPGTASERTMSGEFYKKNNVKAFQDLKIFSDQDHSLLTPFLSVDGTIFIFFI